MLSEQHYSHKLTGTQSSVYLRGKVTLIPLLNHDSVRVYNITCFTMIGEKKKTNSFCVFVYILSIYYYHVPGTAG